MSGLSEIVLGEAKEAKTTYTRRYSQVLEDIRKCSILYSIVERHLSEHSV